MVRYDGENAEVHANIDRNVRRPKSRPTLRVRSDCIGILPVSGRG